MSALLSGYADFYASTVTVKGLKKEFGDSLKVYLELCEEEGIEPYKNYSGKFVVRVEPDLHERIATQASGKNQSLNQWIAEALNAHWHFHMSYVDGVFDPRAQFYPVRPPTISDLVAITHKIALRVSGYLESDGYLARDAESARC